MSGYVGAETTENVFTDGYFNTGDIGYVDDKGYVFLIGRSKEVIKVKGYVFIPHTSFHAPMEY